MVHFQWFKFNWCSSIGHRFLDLFVFNRIPTSFVTQLHHNENNLAVLIVTTIKVIYAFAVIFVGCELGQRINIAFAECADKVVLFDWYLFPVKFQRMLPLIINFTQQPIDIKCFGSLACDRDTLKKVRTKMENSCHSSIVNEPTLGGLKSIVFSQVIKTAFSYFTMLRQFYYWINGIIFDAIKLKFERFICEFCILKYQIFEINE